MRMGAVPGVDRETAIPGLYGRALRCKSFHDGRAVENAVMYPAYSGA